MKLRRNALVAGAVAIGLLLSGCVGSYVPQPASSTSKPTGEKVAADLQPFYDQVVHWKSCDSGFQCATAQAPLDWANPSGTTTISLALIRKPATGTSKGALLVNPGGPGASGVDFVKSSLTYAADAKLRSNYDIVGFDPRGVGSSTAVKCYTAPAQMDAFLYDILPGTIGSTEWIAEDETQSAAFGASCKQLTGDLLGHVDTDSAAKDMDMLRAALGQKKLDYLGYSYGTLLGATYADLFPKKVGRMVLDGALDPAVSSFEVTKVQAVGFENNMRAYLKYCLAHTKCPFTGTVDEGMAKVRGILDQLDANPITNSDGRRLGSATMFSAIILPLYSQDNWPYLNQLFTDVDNGSAAVAFELADSLNDRTSDGTYTDNSTEAFDAINCLDYNDIDYSVATQQAQAAQLEAAAPTFGREMAWGFTCQGWPYPPTRTRTVIHAAGAGPILVVGTTNDPATPYVWAQALAKELDSGHLITRNGNGHTGYNKGNACVDGAVDNYFVDGTVPSSDPKC
ncbi:MAG: alpha/beta hydrolase [Actinomycetota bacterium]